MLHQAPETGKASISQTSQQGREAKLAPLSAASDVQERPVMHRSGDTRTKANIDLHFSPRFLSPDIGTWSPQ